MLASDFSSDSRAPIALCACSECVREDGRLLSRSTRHRHAQRDLQLQQQLSSEEQIDIDVDSRLQSEHGQRPTDLESVLRADQEAEVKVSSRAIASPRSAANAQMNVDLARNERIAIDGEDYLYEAGADSENEEEYERQRPGAGFVIGQDVELEYDESEDEHNDAKEEPRANDVEVDAKEEAQEAAQPAIMQSIFHDDEKSQAVQQDDELTNLLNAALFQNSPLSLLESLNILTVFSVKHKMTVSACKDMFEVVRALLPTNSSLPTYSKAEELLQKSSPSTLKARKVDVCPNFCTLYYDSTEDASYKHSHRGVCPVCCESRYDEHGKPKRWIYHIPLLPQIQSLFADSTVAAKMLLKEPRPALAASERMFSIQDSPGWRERVVDTGFCENPRNVVMSCTYDGVNPFQGSQYTLWPIVCNPLNLEEPLRSSPAHCMLTILVPGPSKPSSFAHLTYPFTDELVALDRGYIIQDASQNARFPSRARVLLSRADLPAGAGAEEGCFKCRIKGQYEASIKRMTYPFYESPECKVLRTDAEIKEQGAAAQRCDRVNMERSNPLHTARQTGVRDVSFWFRVPYYSMVSGSCIDAMHVCSDTCRNFFDLMKSKRLPKEPKSKLDEDGGVVPPSEEEKSQHERRQAVRNSMVQWSVSQKDQDAADKRYVRLQAPSDIVARSKMPFQRTGHFKAADWVNFVRYLHRHVLRGCLRLDILSIIFDLFDCIGQILSYGISVNEARALEQALLDILRRFKATAPLTEFRCDRTLRVYSASDWIVVISLITHLLVHFPRQLEYWGPSPESWCFSAERFLSWLSSGIRSRRHPEASFLRFFQFSRQHTLSMDDTGRKQLLLKLAENDNEEVCGMLEQRAARVRHEGMTMPSTISSKSFPLTPDDADQLLLHLRLHYPESAPDVLPPRYCDKWTRGVQVNGLIFDGSESEIQRKWTCLKQSSYFLTTTQVQQDARTLKSVSRVGRFHYFFRMNVGNQSYHVARCSVWGRLSTDEESGLQVVDLSLPPASQFIDASQISAQVILGRYSDGGVHKRLVMPIWTQW